jgi:hypothetical protein
VKSFWLLAFVFSLPVFADEPIGTTVQVPVELRAWQIRRQESQSIIVAGLTDSGDPQSYKALDALLSDYEKNVLTRTPLENLDLIGQFYLPREGAEKCLSVVVLNCVLGWYDALRFASDSGRAEILDNEHFFGRVYFLGGDAAKSSITKLMKEHPERVKILVAQGIGFAEKFKNTTNYDRRWPDAYGLERMINAMGGKSESKLLPESAWDNAWEEAKAKVEGYYDIR